MNTALQLAAITLLAAGTSLPVVSAFAQDEPPGITTPMVFPPFDPNAPSCSRPVGLVPTLAYVQENDRAFLEG
ncbi:MAG: hypothetical protein EON93_21480, partial [Burkholderiales bacterium]